MAGRLRWEWHLWRMRWLIFLLMGVWAWYANGQRENVRFYPVLFLFALFTIGYNLLLWRLLHSEHRTWHPLVYLSGNVAFIALGLSLTGVDTPLVFLYLLPIVSASLWYGPLAFLLCYLLIFVGNATAGWFILSESEQIKLLTHLALLGLLGFAGAFLAYEEQRRALELSSLQRISQTIASAPDRQLALQQLIGAVRDALNVEKVVFLLYDEAGEDLVAQPPAAGVTEEELNRTRVPRGEGVSWHVFLSGQPYWVHDAQRDPRVSQRFAKIYGARSVLSAPLQINEQPLGVVHAINKQGNASFVSEDLQLLALLSSQMALILANARLHDDLKRERTMLNAILHSVSGGVIVTNAQGEVILINPSAEHLLHVSARECKGRLVEEVISDQLVVSILENARNSRETVTEEITLRDLGNAIVRVDCTPVTDKGGTVLGHVAVLHDITELRRLDQMQSEFISSVSHELRTPLTSIKAFAATLLRDVEFDRTTQREFLGIINSQCDRLSRLINDLLNISRIESGRPLELRYSQVDVRAVVQRVLRAESLFTNKHRFETDLKPEAATMEADEDKLARILTNLVNNAVKYSPDGGTVTVATHAENETIVFAVRDEGMGIPEQERTAIFDKFYQIDGSRTRRVGGNGLGLFLVKQMVEAHKGEIWVESEVGHGSTFFFRLPQRRSARPAVSRADGTASTAAPVSEPANLH